MLIDMKKVIILVFLFSFSAHAQTIKGKASDQNGSLPFISILLKKAATPDLVEQFTSTNENGEFFFTVKNQQDSLLLEAQSMSHDSQELPVPAFKESQNLTIDFFLLPRSNSLQEVVIEVKKKPIRVKNDTTTYNPDSFKDGTERVVEDLLKKLPGIKVEESGKITFNGKTIKKFLLDGDDLFDSQYTIGTRNIDVNMVQNVQPIENFAENKLLKGLMNDDDVAINLTLKKMKSNVSGTVTLGYGTDEKRNIKATGILISKKYKSFGVVNSNNVGSNSSPYSFNNGFSSLENFKNSNSFAEEIISEGNFYSQLDLKQHNINSNFYAGVSSLVKLKKDKTLKFNVGLYDDRLKRNNSSITDFSLNNENFTIATVENTVKKPRMYDAGVNLNQSFKDSSAIELDSKLFFSEVNTRSLTDNNGIFQRNDIKSERLFFKNELHYTKRLSESEALQINGLYSKSSTPQQLYLDPGISLTENDLDIISQNTQNSRFDKDYLEIESLYVKKFNKTVWKLTGKYNLISNNFNSNLRQIDNGVDQIVGNDFKNDLKYNVNIGSLKNSFGFRLGRLSTNFDLSASFYDFKLKDDIRNKDVSNNRLIITPSLALLYPLSNKKFINFIYNYNQLAPQENNLFEGLVQTDYRSFRNNEANFTFLKAHSFSLNYSYNNLLSITQFNFRVSHTLKENNFLLRNEINPNYNTTTTFLSDLSNKSYNFSANGEQYFQSLKSVIEFTSAYYIGLSNNVVNNSEVRDVQINNLMLEMVIKPGVATKKIFLSNKITYNNSSFSVKDGASNQFSTLRNSLKLVYNITPRLNFNSNLDFVDSDLSMGNNYWFLDSELNFKSKNNKINYTLQGKNLTGNKTFETISVSDYSRTTSFHSLIERFLLVSVNFRF